MNSYRVIDTGIKNPDVTIAMLAYNHEKYIAEAIESVLCQQTEYSYKIVIAEDCSTDSTREIILSYQKRFPDRIGIILQNSNVGAKQNNYDLLSYIDGIS